MSVPRGTCEPPSVRSVRLVLQNWPLSRGKGALFQALRPLIGRGDVVFELEPGILMKGNLEDYMVRWVFQHCYASNPAFRLSRRLVRPGDIVFDVGANVGMWALGAAARAGDRGEVHAFEPIQANVLNLEENARLNGIRNLKVNNVAVSDKVGSTVIYQPSYFNSGHASLGARHGVENPVDVLTCTLDGYCEQHGLDGVDLLKIDTEGAELLVLRGATRLLASKAAPAILFEVNEETAGKLGSSAATVKGLLAGHGYTIYDYNGESLRKVDPATSEEPGDLFAFKADHREKLGLRDLIPG